jgi:hypothetical protein
MLMLGVITVMVKMQSLPRMRQPMHDVQCELSIVRPGIVHTEVDLNLRAAMAPVVLGSLAAQLC